MRVVLDTNVWLSGLMLPASLPGQVVRAWRASRLTLVLSDPLFDEIGCAMRYDKVRRRIPLTDAELDRFLAELRYLVEWADINGTPVRVPRDRRDDLVLATFVASRSDALVSGDLELLALAPGYAVLTPRQFHDQFLR
jgi:putative PIN family toxin of toxin-antitoxin system